MSESMDPILNMHIICQNDSFNIQVNPFFVLLVHFVENNTILHFYKIEWNICILFLSLQEKLFCL